ncbi:MAG: DUF1659 domain-containing protein [Caldicoprobacter sp.]|uniref:DUF1659 domain-containing protein n=1 Tax=Caldicoprobacter sp. TaxID=2004500 RepID=UPI000DB360AC|nr:hypothetical protein [Clostridia bacterium]PZN11648.1 MAG: hypothetical protein DIU64_02030 [Caldicoprobacter oshimai]
MALEVRPMAVRVQIQLDMGQDQDGRRVTRTRTLSRIKADVSDEDLYSIAYALASLQSHPVIAIRKTAQFDYVNV